STTKILTLNDDEEIERRDVSTISGGGGSLTDGDKGDITVASSGTSWTIDNGVISTAKLADDAVTYSKIQNVVANNVILGNNSGAGGIVDELTATEVTA